MTAGSKQVSKLNEFHDISTLGAGKKWAVSLRPQKGKLELDYLLSDLEPKDDLRKSRK